MGIVPFFLREANLTQKPDDYEYTIAVRAIQRTDDPLGNPTWVKPLNYGLPRSMMSEVVTFPMENFNTISKRYTTCGFGLYHRMVAVNLAEQLM